jgi:two-component sensor histidine kinase
MIDLELNWSESGGPPVTAPSRRGFGTRLIERGLSAELRSKVTLDFRPEGLRCTISAKLAAAAE